MKVNKKDLAVGADVRSEEAIKALRSQLQEKAKGVKDKESQAAKTDTVDVKLGALIQSELNPTQMAADRRARIEELKQLIKEGKYHPSSEAVARSVITGLAEEALDAPPESDN